MVNLEDVIVEHHTFLLNLLMARLELQHLGFSIDATALDAAWKAEHDVEIAVAEARAARNDKPSRRCVECGSRTRRHSGLCKKCRIEQREKFDNRPFDVFINNDGEVETVNRIEENEEEDESP